MKGKDKIYLNDRKENDYLILLNTSARDFYKGVYGFVSKDYANNFKSNILATLVQFERMIRRVFNSNLELEHVNIRLFEKMFPNLSKNMFHIKSKEDVLQLGDILSSFRNLNSHSIPSHSDLAVFRKDYSFIAKQKVMHPEIKYLTDENELTVAGMVFIVLNLVREETIKTITTKDNRFGLLINGTFNKDDGKRFVSEISKVNLNIQIRDDKKKTVLEAVLGDRYEDASVDGSSVNLVVGSIKAPIMTIHAEINNEKIVVKKDTLTSIYYEENYVLDIEDKKHFLKLANEMPPFILVDLLHKLSVTRFTEAVYKDITINRWNRVSKLMFAKFFLDKNIDILLAGEEQADIRINSNVCGSSLTVLFMRLEKLIIKFNDNVHVSEMDYSRIPVLLSKMGLPLDLITSLVAIRNCAFHGNILGEYVYEENKTIHYSLETIVNSLFDFLVFLEENNCQLFEYFSNDTMSFFVKPMLAIRANLFTQESITFFNEYPNYSNLDELIKKNNFYNHCTFDVSLFVKFFNLCRRGPYYMKISIGGLNFDLMLSNYHRDVEYLDSFIKKHGFKIESETNDTVIRYITLSK